MLRWVRKDEQVVQNRYMELVEKELKYYRDKFESERSRGDRVSDELLQSRGALPVSDLGVEKLDQAEDRMKESMEIMRQQLGEIYGDGAEEESPAEAETPAS